MEQCFNAVKDSEDVNSGQVKKINRTLRVVERTLERLHERQSKANHGPLSEETTRIKPHGGELYIWCTLGANTECIPHFSEHLMKRMMS